MDLGVLEKLKDYNLLFIENEQGIRDNFQELFSLLFNNVYVGKDGLEGLELYKKHSPDLIITDIKMPNMDGIQLTKKIRERDNKTSIVIISAHTEQELLMESIPLHLVDYVVKPLNQTKLNSVFTKFLKENQIEEFVYDYEKSKTVVKGEEHVLSLKENLFLNKLINENRVISYYEIEEEIWESKEMSQNALRLFIKNLRKKLPEGYIKNIQNHGYSKR
ncbi:MAG: response regulator [Campylobacterales bacterium]|nr:response regulator [Campylobacterales bacterium]